MQVVVPLGEKTVVLQFGSFSDEIDVDQLTSIDYSNLFGEIVTVSALLNRIGLLQAAAESVLSEKKLDCDIYGATLSRQYRREANVSGGKFTLLDEGKQIMIKLTEDSLESAILLDPVYQNKKKAIINAQRDYAFLSSLYWSVQSKDKKLSVLLKGTTPEDFYNELIDGVVNGIMISKPADTWTQRTK